ncbi:hypothetical protein ElyMa_002784100 [Elysia marginata]|uniref:Uncharacterized protein n=1 Tax=Elysia marginata TaxID=1093978 RepID=A0AAV4HP09_9GAST|nr:hypothetical protein ElyMa_002784100 [Elysia marginata]
MKILGIVFSSETSAGEIQNFSDGLFKVKFMERRGNAYIWPEKEDITHVPIYVQHRSKQGVIDVQVPAPVVKYNSAMFGVDLNDQYRAYYPVGSPGTK